jgi:uncharacterized protein YndB with AHSA1/START domain
MTDDTKPETQSLSVEYDFPQPPQKVWRTLTEPELLAAWLMPNDIQAVVGHRFTFKTDPAPWWDGIVHCEVLEVRLNEVLTYTWRAAGLDTVVSWTLSATPSGGTRLVLLHSGFLPSNKAAFDGARFGWRLKFGARLRDLLAQVP